MKGSSSNLKLSLSEKLNRIDWKWWLVFMVACATLVAAILPILNQDKKELKAYVVSEGSIAKIDKEYKNDLEIIYKGIKIEEIGDFVFRIYNSGNQPIKAEDFESPISLEFNEQTKLIDSDVINTNPENKLAKVLVKDNKVFLESLLINPEDTIEISCVSNSLSRPTINARIIGVKEVKLEEMPDEKNKYILFSVMLFFPIFGGLITGMVFWAVKNTMFRFGLLSLITIIYIYRLYTIFF